MYLDVGYINDINISIAQTSLGVVQSQNYRTITTNSTNLLSILKVGQAVKIGNEIKRVSSIKNNSTFSVTQQWDDVHVGQTAYKDFTSNDDGSLYQDSFSNYLHIASSIGGIRTLERCTKFEGCNSLFIYDDADSENEKQESFIIGTYDLSKDDTRNVQSVLIMKPNRSFNYIINMVETKQSFTGNSTSISSMQNNVYGIWLNGKYLPSTDWYRSGNNIVFNSITTLRRNNYIRVLHYPAQTSTLRNSVNITLGYSGYDELAKIEYSKIQDLPIFILKSGIQVNPNYEYYEKRSIDKKQNIKIKINATNKLSFTSTLANYTEADTDNNDIVKHLRYYLKGQEYFRLIVFIKNFNKFMYFNNCRLINPVNYIEGSESNTYSYDIEFSTVNTIGKHLWGDGRWGMDFNWNLVSYSSD